MSTTVENEAIPNHEGWALLAERVGWTGSITRFRGQLAPICATRIHTGVVASGQVRTAVFPVLPSRAVADLLCGEWQLLFDSGALRRRLLQDDEAANDCSVDPAIITDPAHVSTAAAWRAALLTPPAEASARSARESSSAAISDTVRQRSCASAPPAPPGVKDRRTSTSTPNPPPTPRSPCWPSPGASSPPTTATDEVAGLRRHDLVIVDEVGCSPVEAQAADLLFQLVSTLPSVRAERAH
ncbi:hypothetical protein ACUN7V_18760 [Quadrisphaera oryzae]|uniref:hypothetical protein n=1 Tax=Quadrisphaera TaxID=317661 RepID=UPI001649658A|nr:hypothetical protein [Quadrisphaera sp. RL12-1S]MBC3762349.1 hypothetical protein [Quadrisphaera sp. RL12-1S]